MAISDVVMAVLCVPFNYTSVMLGRWIFYHWLCPVAQFTQLLSVAVTSFILTVIGIERYLATTHPFSWFYIWLSSHSRLMLSLSWIFGVTYSSLWTIFTQTDSFIYNNTTYYQCYSGIVMSHELKKISLVINFCLPIVYPCLSYRLAIML
ncbi:neuropeptide Y receptor type 6-like [Oppia nitens]|uniref:neuropeptide Y receptor type 6-like n=1 Tax=Oppia nitens TaxID=1686743 RepID=UPI0023DA19D7|nr:neuropeptide Y receptor type 6-like [Oppia nitens]